MVNGSVRTIVALGKIAKHSRNSFSHTWLSPHATISLLFSLATPCVQLFTR